MQCNFSQDAHTVAGRMVIPGGGLLSNSHNERVTSIVTAAHLNKTLMCSAIYQTPDINCGHNSHINAAQCIRGDPAFTRCSLLYALHTISCCPGQQSRAESEQKGQKWPLVLREASPLSRGVLREEGGGGGRGREGMGRGEGRLMDWHKSQ